MSFPDDEISLLTGPLRKRIEDISAKYMWTVSLPDDVIDNISAGSGRVNAEELKTIRDLLRLMASVHKEVFGLVYLARSAVLEARELEQAMRMSDDGLEWMVNKSKRDPGGVFDRIMKGKRFDA